MEEMRPVVDEMNLVVSIVACGPSALKCGAARAPGFVIAVNDAYRHVRHDAVLSMDGRWAKNRLPHLRETFGPIYLRRSAWRHVETGSVSTEILRRTNVFDCDHASGLFGSHTHTLNGSNSGYCALNLAYVMRPEIVYLFGYDHKGEHFHPESEWRQRGEGDANNPAKFKNWAQMCVGARKQFDAVGIRVINTNRDSAVTAFEFGDAP